MRRGGIFRLALKAAILITGLLCLISFYMIMTAGFTSPLPVTPKGNILSITSTPEDMVLIDFGVFSPPVRYQDCRVIILPPGSSGIDSSAEAKLWTIDDHPSGFAYNDSIRLEFEPQINELIGPDSDLGITRDNLVINYAELGKIPEGKWTLFLIFLPTNDLITDATWHMNGPSPTNQSLPFSQVVGHPIPMEEYGFGHPFRINYWETSFFWKDLLMVNLIAFFGLVIIQLVVMTYDRRG